MAELTNEFNAALVRFDPFVFDDSVDQVVLAVPEPVHCFGLRGVVWMSLGKLDAARCEKVANAVEAGLPIHIEPVVRDEIERAKCFACLRRALLKVLVEHLFPTGRVEVGGVRYHTVEVKKDGLVLVAGDHAPADGLHRPLSCYRRTSLSFDSLTALILKLSDLPDHHALIDERPVPDPYRRYLAVAAEDAQG